MQAGTLEPEAAFLDASLLWFYFVCLRNPPPPLFYTCIQVEGFSVYNYSGSKHITEFLKRCGISGSSSHALVARFNASPDEMKAIEKLVHGKEINLEELGERADQAWIRKHFKITGPELTVSSSHVESLRGMPCSCKTCNKFHLWLLAHSHSSIGECIDLFYSTITFRLMMSIWNVQMIMLFMSDGK
ncbi:hypothetical protein SDJN03_24528, partial [Cucurbita argyrosperma subsp. sororia]